MQQNNFYECLPEFELVSFLLILFLVFFFRDMYVYITKIFAERTFYVGLFQVFM